MKGVGTKRLSPKDHEALLKALKGRFEKNMNRHKGLEWAEVQARLEANADKLSSLHEMEKTGGTGCRGPRSEDGRDRLF